MTRAPRALVTGGAGFVGSFVVDALVAEGFEVRVVDRLHPRAHRERPRYLRDDVEYRFEDLSDPGVAARAVAGVDVVSHQASMVGLGVDFSDAPDYARDNGLATAVLLGALHEARFRGRMVLASSMVVYGEGGYRCPVHGPVAPCERDPGDLHAGRFEHRCPGCGRFVVPEPVSEDAPVRPRNVYAATKLHQEHLCAAYAREHGGSTTALRYHNVYGPRMPSDTPYAGVASIFRSALDAGRAPQVFEDGAQTRDFVHVRDVARANVLAALADPPYDGALNVASGAPRTVLDLATALADAHGPSAPRPVVVGGWRAGDVRHVFASPARAARHLGFTADVRFEDGVADLVRAPRRAGAA